MGGLWRWLISVLWGAGPVVWVQDVFGSGWRWFFEAVSFLGSLEAVMVIFSITLWLSGRRPAYRLLCAVLLVTVTNSLLWTLIEVHRPDEQQIISRAHLGGLSSFPSGHTMMATALWGTLAALGQVPKLVPVLIIPAVMLSRLYLGAHYLGDVLGGVVIGALLVAVFFVLWPRLVRRLSRLPFWVFVVLGLCAPFGVLLFLGFTSRGLELFGAAVAAGIGLPLSHRYVRLNFAKGSPVQKMLRVVIGAGGMGALLFASGLTGDRPLLQAAFMAVAVLWGY